MDLSTDLCAYIYVGLALATLFVCIIRSAAYYYLVLRISQRLHDFMFSSVIAAPMRFFDTNPSGNFIWSLWNASYSSPLYLPFISVLKIHASFFTGRILNRFAKDMGSVDEILPKIILDSSQVGLTTYDCNSLRPIGNQASTGVSAWKHKSRKQRRNHKTGQCIKKITFWKCACIFKGQFECLTISDNLWYNSCYKLSYVLHLSNQLWNSFKHSNWSFRSACNFDTRFPWSIVQLCSFFVGFWELYVFTDRL